MNIEMIFDPLEVAMNEGLKLDERHHICPESQWLRAVKRTTGRDDLFVYYHRETENFVLAQWIYTPEKDGVAICMELEVMEKAPDQGGWISLERIKLRCRNADEMVKDIKWKVKKQRAEREAERQELIGMRQEATNHQRKLGNEAIAASMEHANYAKPSEETLDTLNNAARNRIITSG